MTEYKTYTLERRYYPVVPPPPGRMECADGDWQRLDAIYRAFARQYTAMLERDEEWWRERVFPRKCGRAVVYRDAAGQDQGYVLYQVRDGVLTCHEMVWLTEEARRGPDRRRRGVPAPVPVCARRRGEPVAPRSDRRFRPMERRPV